MMEKQRLMLSIILILAIHGKNSPIFVVGQGQSGSSNNVRYFQVSNTKSQLGGSSGTVVRYNSIDGLNGIQVFNNGTFAYSNAGIYFALFGCQVGSPNRNGVGEVHVWFQRSTPSVSTNTDAPFTNTRQTVKRGTTAVLAFQSTFESFVGFTARFKLSAFPTNQCSALGFIATEPDNEPVVPGIIASAIQISPANNPSPLTQVNSVQTQLGSAIGKAVKFNVVVRSFGMDITNVGNDGVIKFNEPGLYFVIACGQVGSSNNPDASGEVHIWTRLNGNDIANSNTIQTVTKGSSTILVSQTVATFRRNDKLQVMFSVTNNNLGLISSTPNNEPAISSMSFSTFKLGGRRNSLPYAQLSSLQTQCGCLTPTIVQFDQNDGSNEITNQNGIIEFQKSGTYFIMAAAQIGSCGEPGVGDVHLWMWLNGQDIANSNTIQTVDSDTSVLISQTNIEIQAGDQLQVRFSTDVTKGTLGLVASQPANEPAVPSIIFSIFQAII